MIEIALLLITSIWVPDSSYNDNMEIEYGYRQVPINYLDIDEDPCNNPNMRACYMSQENPYIEFRQNDPLLHEYGKCIPSIWDHDVLHAWALPAFGVKRDAMPGRVNETWFKADRVGTFYGQCSELCGIKHAFMPITVKVVTDEEYQEWLDEAKIKFAKEEVTNQNNNLIASK